MSLYKCIERFGNPWIVTGYLLLSILYLSGGEGAVYIVHYFAQINPFVSPTLFVAPTDQQYNASVGLKGRLSNNMSYNILEEIYNSWL